MKPTFDELYDATVRLMKIAKRDTGQSRRAANFLLAWWNPESCGGFPISDLWAVDDPIAQDMLTIFAANVAAKCSPEHMLLDAHFEELVAEWRRHLVTPNQT